MPEGVSVLVESVSRKWRRQSVNCQTGNLRKITSGMGVSIGTPNRKARRGMAVRNDLRVGSQALTW
jgi:hypothetical protein